MYNDSALKALKKDSQFPVKLEDNNGNIRKVLIEETINYIKASGNVVWYIKFPWITAEIAPTVTLNFSIRQVDPYARDFTSYFTATIQNNAGTLLVELDSSRNYGKLVYAGKSIIYYEDEEEVKHYYLKLSFVNTVENVYNSYGLNP
jgi:hypothetical protein